MDSSRTEVRRVEIRTGRLVDCRNYQFPVRDSVHCGERSEPERLWHERGSARYRQPDSASEQQSDYLPGRLHPGRDGHAEAPQNLVGDNAYDSDKLDAELRQYGIELVAPHRSNRKNKTQDGGRLRRYCRRWKIERLFAWLQNSRRLVVRYERYADNFLGMLHLGCCLVLLWHL